MNEKLAKDLEEILKPLYIQASLDVLDKKNKGKGKELCERRVKKIAKDIAEKLEVDEEKIREAIHTRMDCGKNSSFMNGLVEAISDANPIKIKQEVKEDGN